MNSITIYKVAADSSAPFDVKTTDNPLVAEKRYFLRCKERTEGDVRLIIESDNPLVPNAAFLLQAGEKTNFEREMMIARKYSLWGTPEQCWKDISRGWQSPTCYQAKALKECMLQSAGGEISTALLAMKLDYHKRTFNHYFSETSVKKMPFIMLQAVMRIAGFPVEDIGVEPLLKGDQ